MLNCSIEFAPTYVYDVHNAGIAVFDCHPALSSSILPSFCSAFSQRWQSKEQRALELERADRASTIRLVCDRSGMSSQNDRTALMSLVVHLPRPGASGPRKCAITLGEKDQDDEEQQGGSDWNEHCSRRTRMTQCDSFQVLTNYRRMISGLIRCCDA